MNPGEFVFTLPVFQSTLPVGERLSLSSRRPGIGIFQSTLPVGGATLLRGASSSKLDISIHAPRGGSDLFWSPRTQQNDNFNPRSPWGERLLLAFSGRKLIEFQSTLPVGGATYQRLCGQKYQQISIHAPRGGSDILYLVVGAQADYFNPRSPWGERRGCVRKGFLVFPFQSTLPVGGATTTTGKTFQKTLFQSTLPVGGATPGA